MRDEASMRLRLRMNVLSVILDCHRLRRRRHRHSLRNGGGRFVNYDMILAYGGSSMIERRNDN